MMTTAEYLDTARLALLRAENIELQLEIRAQAAASNHAKGFVNSSRLRKIRAAINELAQIDRTTDEAGRV